MPIVPIEVDLEHPLFKAISLWCFEDEFVGRMLKSDIPQRIKLENAAIWVYADADKNVVGFGTLTACLDYETITGGIPHLYIPLLAVHPSYQGKGFGKAIVSHLLDTARCARERNNELHNAIFLDVYCSSEGAIRLYEKSGFHKIGDALSDPAAGKDFIIMAKRI